MGIDLVIYALEQMGIKVSPIIAWIILIVGGILVIGSFIGGCLSISNAIRRRRNKTSGVVMSESQGQIHVESHNQQGGITAYQINVQPADRQFSSTSAKQLLGYLKTVTFQKIEVESVGDEESIRFAEQIKIYLDSQGFNVKDRLTLVANRPMKGIQVIPPDDNGVIRIFVGYR